MTHSKTFPPALRLLLNPLAAPAACWHHRGLLRRLVARELEARYRGSIFGILWSILNPIILLTVYTFVFTVVFKAKWGEAGMGSNHHFALLLFAGLLVYNLFAESVARAPGIMLSQVTYIKKVVFPLEILPIVPVFAACVTALISLALLLVAVIALDGDAYAIMALAPLTLLPALLLNLGVCWFLASVGVYFRDLQQLVGVFIMVLMFMSPVFYPISSLPEVMRPYLASNPIAISIEQLRGVVFMGTWHSPASFALLGLGCWLVAHLGYCWFSLTKRGFADVC